MLSLFIMCWMKMISQQTSREVAKIINLQNVYNVNKFHLLILTLSHGEVMSMMSMSIYCAPKLYWFKEHFMWNSMRSCFDSVYVSFSVGFHWSVNVQGDSHHASSFSKGQVCPLWECRRHRRAANVSSTVVSKLTGKGSVLDAAVA